ncbi:GntR family transcriptional regulator [Burkholderia sp. WAC0059]|uniref:GntR family transcriptional regulator n=1 Tax=Burkholderia sp. WAC0059 TaxID=2066022 RepID=UPI000C7EBFB8|nr:GntR family transcriptional regulator [Burkholderia sp. WAC0059]PLZ00469.1 GntR family transcriptional regulator [Burkholderia sp. WAC0059]
MPADPIKPRSAATRTNLAEEVLARLREMAIHYELKPGERLNEVELAERLGVSRTPIREALYRLEQEGFLVESGRGYSRRPLSVKETTELYEARCAIESECIRLAIERADDETLEGIGTFLENTIRNSADMPAHELVALDEAFHERIAMAADNAELLRLLRNLNGRIRFIRRIGMEIIDHHTHAEHRAICASLRRRDAATAGRLLREHIGQRTDQIVESIATGLARIYLGAAYDSAKS